MKDRQTQRAVKNILHNELGITNEKVEQLITDYINNKFDKKVTDFINSTWFESMVNRRLDQALIPFVRENLKHQLAGISINVTIPKSK